MIYLLLLILLIQIGTVIMLLVALDDLDALQKPFLEEEDRNWRDE